MSSAKKIIAVSIVIFLVALIVRFWAVDFNRPLQYDEQVYHFQATQILEGKGFINEYGNITAWRTPVFAVILAVIYKIGGVNISFAQSVLIVFSSLSVVLTYLFTLLLFRNHFTAIVSAIIQTFLFSNIFFAGSLYCESITPFFVISAFLMAVIAIKTSSRTSLLLTILAGLFFGIAILARGYLLFGIISLPIFFLTQNKSKKLAFACLLSAMLVPVGWMIRNAVVFNAFTISTESYQAIWHGNNDWAKGGWNGEWSKSDSAQVAYLRNKYPNIFDGMNEVERSNIFKQEAIGDITGNPVRIIKLLPKKIAIFLYPTISMEVDWVYLFCFPFAVFGLFIVFINKEQRNYLWLLFFPVVCISFVILMSFGDPRFRHPVEFCFAVLASVGVTWVGERLKLISPNKIVE